MVTAKISEVIGELQDLLNGYGDRDIYFRPEKEPGKPGPAIEIHNYVHHLEDDPELGTCYTLG